MLLTEYDEERHIENERRIAADEAYECGKEAGEELLSELTNLLLEASRIKDLKRAAEDTTYRKKLYQEFGLKS